MATCQNCGNELTGQYCEICGARAPVERAVKKERKVQAAPKSTRPAGALVPGRIGRTTILAIIAVVLIVAGALTGFYIASTPATSSAPADVAGTTAPSDADLTPVAQAEYYMDQGVDLMQKGDRAGAVAQFRKSIAQFESVLKEEPDNLYAKSYLGLVYYYAGDSKKAVDNENAVLKADPNYLWAIFNLAWMNETGGKTAEAIKLYQHYLDVAETEKQDVLKYAEQPELIDQQIQAAKDAIQTLQGSAGK